MSIWLIISESCSVSFLKERQTAQTLNLGVTSIERTAPFTKSHLCCRGFIPILQDIHHDLPWLLFPQDQVSDSRDPIATPAISTVQDYLAGPASAGDVSISVLSSCSLYATSNLLHCLIILKPKPKPPALEPHRDVSYGLTPREEASFQ